MLYAILRTTLKGSCSPSASLSAWHGGKRRKLCSWLRVSKRVSMLCVHAKLDETLPSLMEDLQQVDQSSERHSYLQCAATLALVDTQEAPDAAMRALEGAGKGALCQGCHVLQIPLLLVITRASTFLMWGTAAVILHCLPSMVMLQPVHQYEQQHDAMPEGGRHAPSPCPTPSLCRKCPPTLLQCGPQTSS